MKKSVLRLLAAASATALAVVVPTAVHAATPSGGAGSFAVCTSRPGAATHGLDVGPTQYKITATKAVYVADRSTRVDGPGGTTIAILRGKPVKAAARLGSTTASEAGVVFSKASAQLGVTVSRTVSRVTPIQYQWTVPKSWSTGFVEAGVRGYSITYDRGHYKSPCTWVSEKKDTITGVTIDVQYVNSSTYASTPKP